MVSGINGVGYYSIYPYVHYAFFLPFDIPAGKKELNSGWYIGAGGGYINGKYTFPEGDVQLNNFNAHIITGFNIGNFLDISYTLRTEFKNAYSKVSLGYIYRFK